MKFEWIGMDDSTSRAQVIGGWIVRFCDDVAHNTGMGIENGWDWRSSMVFVPDPSHQWDIDR
jgi:hypothetical protein